MITIAPLNAAADVEYGQFLLRAPRNLIYASTEFRNFLQAVVPGEPRYLIARDDTRIVGGLACFVANDKTLGTVVNSLPWYGSHGGCTVASDGPPGVREALLLHYRRVISAHDNMSATLILSPFEEEFLSLYRHDLDPVVTDRRIGQITELPLDGPEVGARLEKVITQKTRNLVRKSLKQGFTLDTSDSDTNWQFLYSTHVENMAAVGGKAKSWPHFAALREKLPATWRQVSVARLGGKPVAALLLLNYNKTVEYFTPVIKHEHRSVQPLSFLIWQAMLVAIENGFRWWNWGGTWLNQESLHHFKSGWGADDLPYSYLINATADAIGRIKNERNSIEQAFPYYYVYPYSLLN